MINKSFISIFYVLLISLATLYPNLDTYFGWSESDDSIEFVECEIEEEESSIEEYLSLALEFKVQFEPNEMMNKSFLFYSTFYHSDYLSQPFRPPIKT